jgi:hypothetical protein
MESRVALLERIARTTAASLERIERRLETMDGRFTGRESPFTAIDRGLEAFAPEHRAPFRWLMGIMLGGFGAMLGVMALGFHWL